MVRRHPAARSRLVAAGVSTAATVGLVAAMAAQPSEGASTTSVSVTTPATTAPSTVARQGAAQPVTTTTAAPAVTYAPPPAAVSRGS
jgi:hypothetical protein